MSDNPSESSLAPRERTRLRAGDRRLMLVQAAYHLIAEKGLLGLRIRDVADRVGVNHTTLVYHFPTKVSLVEAVIDYVGTLFLTIQAPESLVGTSDSPRERLQAYFVNLAFQIQTSPQHLLVIDELFLEAQRDPVIHQLVQAEVVWEAYLTAIIEDGIRQGIFASTVPTITIVKVIMVFCKGLPLQISKGEDATQIVDQFAEWVMWIVLNK